MKNNPSPGDGFISILMLAPLGVFICNLNWHYKKKNTGVGTLFRIVELIRSLNAKIQVFSETLYTQQLSWNTNFSSVQDKTPTANFLLYWSMMILGFYQLTQADYK